MKNNSPGQSFPVSQKIYACLLRAYPRRHREEYGAAMAQLFRDQCRDAWNESRGWGLAKLWLRVLPDLASTSISERLAAFNERKTINDKLASLFHNRTTPGAVFFRVFTAVFLVTLLFSTAITFILPESYASTARILVEPDTLIGQNISGRFSRYPDTFSEGDFRDIQSDSVLNMVINKLNLNTAWGKKYFNGEALKTTQTLDMLKARLQTAWIAGGREHNIFSITVFSDDKNEAAQIANAIVDAYCVYYMEAHEKLMESGVSAIKTIIHPVKIIELAQPAFTPAKPNKPLNIFIGAIVGGFLGLLVGAISALVSAKFGKRTHKNAVLA